MPTTTTTKPKITKQNLFKAMASLGKTTTDIAKSLKKLRIKGVLGNSQKCVLATFLKRYFGIGKGRNKNTQCYVAQESCIIVTQTSKGEEKRITHTNTPASRGFIMKFDQGNFHELEKPKK